MKASKDIDFLTNYWEDAKRLGEDIKINLPKMSRPCGSIVKSGNMYIVPFSKLGDKWGVKEVLKHNGGESSSLQKLGEKIEDMIYRNRAKDIKIMLNSILSGKIKVWSTLYDTKGKRLKRREKKENYKVVNFHYSSDDKYCEGEEQDFCYGHFRYESEGFVLEAEELLHLKRYFDL